jgi:predicted RNase H-like HicB family nuclease
VAELSSLKVEEIIRAEGITTMKYTIILTEKPSGGIRVSVPALPECTVEADNRDDAIHLAREAIAQIVSRSEIVHVDISGVPRVNVKKTSLREQHYQNSPTRTQRLLCREAYPERHEGESKGCLP